MVSNSPAVPAATPGSPGCWRTVGVYGTGACPDLARYVHCRNCPVHGRTGLEVLNRPAPEGYQAQWTEHYAKAGKARASSSSSAVPFRLAAEWLALPTECLQEVTERRPIHSLPNARQTVLGIANMRGEVLICISLGHLLGPAGIQPRNILRTSYERLLVLNWAGQRVGFPADEVQGPHRFHAENVKPPPAALARANPAYAESVLQWRDRTLVLLDPDLLFSALNRNLA